MAARCRGQLLPALWVVWTICVVSTGCQTSHKFCPPPNDIPRELTKVSLPPYVIEPPDILQIDAVSVVPKPPHRLEPLDQILIQVGGTIPTEPIEGVYTVDTDGTVNLGFAYGAVPVAGLTVEEARAAIEKQLKVVLTTPKVNVALAQSRGLQQIRGEHLVRPDGTVALGTYGSVYVTGMTLSEAKAAIEQHLAQFLLKPEIAIDVIAYNSKVYYVISDGAGYGEQVARFPATGNETVLDAMSQIGGLGSVASKRHIWIARPTPASVRREQILPVDWEAIVEGGSTVTNYQILPGDRVYVKADGLITADNYISKLIAPFERIMGFTLLGNATVRTLQQGGGTFGGGGFGGGAFGGVGGVGTTVP